MIKVMVVDDHPVVAEGIATLLRETPYQLVCRAERGSEAVELAAETQPDVILLDLRLPDMLAPEVIHGMRRTVPGATVLLFTAHSDHAAIEAALAAGAAGCVLKDISRSDLVDTLERLARGERIASPALRGSAVARAGGRMAGPPLTQREYEILRRVALGEMNAEIATAMHLAHHTVNTYWKRALQKLGARNRAEAITRAHEYGLL